MTNPLIAATKKSAWKIASSGKMLVEFIRDYRRYAMFSTPSGKDELATLTGRHLECQVTKDYHRIEKGLSIHRPKRPFGVDPEMRLSKALGSRMQDHLPNDAAYLEYAGSALNALKLWNETEQIDPLVSPAAASLPEFDIHHEQLDAFFRSRRSVRSFDTERELDLDLVQRAVELAGNSPSVCNRQSWKTHLYTRSTDIGKVLSHQSGNRGFGHTAKGLLVVTTDTRLFSGSGERNQRWVDGGLFAMSIVWALHGLGISTCMLNWSKGNSDSNALREDAGISSHEDVVVMIALGYAIDDHRIARSPRRKLSEILVHHQL